MTSAEKYMNRCLELAHCGFGHVAPNPMVGCVVVHNDFIIGEGYHKEFGEAHAEVNAINDAIKRNYSHLLSASTLFVNLEPCSHLGKTPPCADLIVKHSIPKVIIGCRDSNEKVAGRGIKKLRENGCDVQEGILENAARALNKRFFTWHEKKRPYIILKWAQSADNYIGQQKNKIWLSGKSSTILSHKWRSEEQAIMVGTNTAITDNPKLNVRHWSGRNPARIVPDRHLRIHPDNNIFDKSQTTYVFTSEKRESSENLTYFTIDFNKEIIQQMLDQLYYQNIQSVLIEGGSQLLQDFISQGIWDEARIIKTPKMLYSGITAPVISGTLISRDTLGEDELLTLQKAPLTKASTP